MNCLSMWFALGSILCDAPMGLAQHRNQKNVRTLARGRPAPVTTRKPAVRTASTMHSISGGFDTVQSLVAPGPTLRNGAPIAHAPPQTVYEGYGLGESVRAEGGSACDDCGIYDACSECGSGAGLCHCGAVGWLLDWSRADLWLGTVGFSGESSFPDAANVNDSRAQIAGNFGFQQGFNFGSRLPGLLGGQLGSQLGMRFTQSQLDGTTAGHDSRTQAFATAGLFRRVDYGLQGGLVFDYLHDDWIYQADLLQLRGELSYLFSPCHDLGFRFTDSQQVDDTLAIVRGSAVPLPVRLAGLNSYRFFYRWHFGETSAGTAELQAGFTEDSAALLGMGLKAPLQGQLGLAVDATYVLPPASAAMPYTREAWNLNVGVVWTPGRRFGSQRDYYRPLLDVAHNGSFLSKLLD